MIDACRGFGAGDPQPFGRLPLAGTPITAERCNWRSQSEPEPEPRPPQQPNPYASMPAALPPEAEALDRQACSVAAMETQCRLVEARIVAELLRRKLWRPLGFSRLRDYAAEWLGVCDRTLQEDARVVTALESLPAIQQAFLCGAIRWTHARMLVRIATPQTERGWLRLALISTTRRLAELLDAARRGDPAPGEGAAPNACASGGGDGAAPDACAPGGGDGAGPNACASRW